MNELIKKSIKILKKVLSKITFSYYFFRAERPKNHVCDVENCGKGKSLILFYLF
jgi:hypothetical protein